MALISSFVFAVAIAVNNLTKALRFTRPFAFSARFFFLPLTLIKFLT